MSECQDNEAHAAIFLDLVKAKKRLIALKEEARNLGE
jgi:hypothetical protein